MSTQTIEQILHAYAQTHIDIIKIEYYCDDITIWVQPVHV